MPTADVALPTAERACRRPSALCHASQGIIDILTSWTCAKRLEHLLKLLQNPLRPDAHSCVPPLRYADRFERAMRKWFD